MTRAEPPRLVLQELIQGAVVVQAIAVAARLGIPDLLDVRAMGSQELAAATGCDGPSLYRVLRLLTAVGLFTQQPDGSFALATLGGYLRRETPGSLRSMAMAYGQSPFWPVLGALGHSVHTGEPAFRQVFGVEIFEYYPSRPDEAELFNQLMTDLTASVAPTVAQGYDFTAITSLVDVGGGRGQMLASILQAYPHLQAVLFDLPHVVADATSLLQAAGVSDRVRVIAGDAFSQVPPGHDAYLLSRVIHDWNDDRAITLLQCCRQAMTGQGRLLLVERVIPTDAAPLHMLQSDLFMLVAPGGQERTANQYRQVLAAADLDLRHQWPVLAPYSILEARPADAQPPS